MMERLRAAAPEFTNDWWHAVGDTHRPLRAGTPVMRRAV
jgi:hypothetical protein